MKVLNLMLLRQQYLWLPLGTGTSVLWTPLSGWEGDVGDGRRTQHSSGAARGCGQHPRGVGPFRQAVPEARGRTVGACARVGGAPAGLAPGGSAQVDDARGGSGGSTLPSHFRSHLVGGGEEVSLMTPFSPTRSQVCASRRRRSTFYCSHVLLWRQRLTRC